MQEIPVAKRVLYTFLTMLVLVGCTELSLDTFLVLLSVLVFLNSYVIQYAVLHLVMQRVFGTPSSRRRFLAQCLFVVFIFHVIALGSIPTHNDVAAHAELWRLQRSWALIFSFFSSGFVATMCTWNAFRRHGALG